MPDLLLELFSEEIPARMQARAADDLRKLVTERLADAGLLYAGAKAFVTPRRLALAVEGIPVKQPDLKEEKKGPRVGAPEGAIAGFLRSCGLTSIAEAKVVRDKKGDFYVAAIEKPGRPAIEVIGAIMPDVVKTFPWPKSMRWGDRSLSWIRPLHSIVATFGPETEEPEIVAFSVDGITAGDETRGHRFLSPQPFKVRRLHDYAAKLEKAKVVLDPERRKQIILADAKNLAFAQGCELVEDAGLLDEVAGLVEWPVVLMGAFDQAFLAIPPEVIRATIRNNQKCFVLRDPQTAKLVDKFILVANTEAEDGGKAIVAGNERVIRARLSDASFFYQTDLKTRLEDRLPKFEKIVFHEKLGTQAERIARIEALAGHIGRLIDADIQKTERAARLCKADLLTEVVGEFPELQGLMGKYYAEAQGEDAAVALACEEHYKPLGPKDQVPTDPVAIAVALADKIDTLVGFWAIDAKPTGSKDPYALRRAALGEIRLILENNLRIKLSKFYGIALLNFLLHADINIEHEVVRILTDKYITFPDWVELASWKLFSPILNYDGLMDRYFDLIEKNDPIMTDHEAIKEAIPQLLERADTLSGFLTAAKMAAGRFPEAGERVVESIAAALPHLQEAWLSAPLKSFAQKRLEFDADRLKIQLREQGARHDLVDAVFALEGQDDLVLIVHRVEALGKFLDSEDGKNLLAGHRRATNIIRIEEKKDARQYVGDPDPSLYRQHEERALASAIGTAKQEASAAVAREEFAAAMRAMAKLRPYVDAFFDAVTVNVADGADKQELRENRLRLLNEIREATRAVADFSRVEG